MSMPSSVTIQRRWLLLVFCLFAGVLLKAQGDMRFFGTATKDGSPLSGATVTVLMDGKQIINLTTGKNGKFKFTIDIGHSYQINYSAPGCVSMYMTMDLHTPADKAWIYPDYAAEIPFFSANDPKVKTELFAQKPFIKVIFDGDKGFYDDPSYRFIDEIFKDPLEEQKKQQEELEKKQAAEQAAKDAADQAAKDQAEKDRLAQEEADRQKAIDEANKKNTQTNTQQQEQPKEPEQQDAGMETEAIRLEKEKQDKLNQEKQNKSIRAQYENNLLKLVAESERQNNIEKFNKMKEDAMGNSVVQTLRKEAQVKAQNDFLIEQNKEKQRQQLANSQLKAERLRALVETAAQVERDMRASEMKPVLSTVQLNYSPSPNVIVTTESGFFLTTVTTIISWPGGVHTTFRTDEYWWGTRYYYHDGKETDLKTYESELYRHKRS